MTTIHIGFDDTDSEEGMCTTYLATDIVQELLDVGARFIDYPNLIRLNPNIPWKTRGNGALALRLTFDKPDEVFEIASAKIEDLSDWRNGKAAPSIVMLVSDLIPDKIKGFSKDATSRVLGVNSAVKLIRECGLRYRRWGSGRGVVGALAALGNPLEDDYTLELIAYRSKEHWGSPRKIDPESVSKVSRESRYETFNTFDHDVGRVLITPHGPDPVYFGLRGEQPSLLLDAARNLGLQEPVERFMIFRSNQGTGVHLQPALKCEGLKAYYSGRLKGKVASKPYFGMGGHVYFMLDDSTGQVNCAVYAPAAELRKEAIKLIEGDHVELGGSVRRKSQKNPAAFNVEYIRVIRLAENYVLSNPLCKVCGVRMESSGRLQGFRCGKCGYRLKDGSKLKRLIPRNLRAGLYFPPPRSQRHLTKPPYRHLHQRKELPKKVRKWYGFDYPLEFNNSGHLPPLILPSI